MVVSEECWWLTEFLAPDPRLPAVLALYLDRLDVDGLE